MSSAGHNHGHGRGGDGWDALADPDKFEQPRPPTKIATAAKNYGGKIVGAYIDIRSVAGAAIEDRDVFGVGADALATPPPQFDFETDARKVERFRDWLARQQRDDVLTVISRDRNPYVRASYSTGLRWARARLREQGYDVGTAELEQAFNLGVHQDSLQLLYTRNYAALEGITAATSKEIGRVLSDGFAEGVGPDELARRIRDVFDDTSIVRARTLARTETANAHTVAAANRYERFGVKQVDVLTYDPCPICVALAADNPHPVGEAAGLLPAHPNCVCSIAPSDGNNS